MVSAVGTGPSYITRIPLKTRKQRWAHVVRPLVSSEVLAAVWAEGAAFLFFTTLCSSQGVCVDEVFDRQRG
jgi:hypothetical protein